MRIEPLPGDLSPSVEILSVDRLEAIHGLRGFGVDAPAAGDASEEPAVRVDGWVVGDASPAVSFEVAHGRNVIWEESLHRREIPAEVGDIEPGTKVGLRAVIGTIGLEPEFELELRAVLEDDGRRPFAKVRGRRTLLQPPPAGSLRAIRVACMRRSGSSWLMRLLAAHPAIVVFPAYPYEIAPGRYWAHMLKALSEPSAPAEMSVRYAAEPRRVGNNPYYEQAIRAEPGLRDWYGRQYVEGLADLCRRNADGWYRTVAEANGKEEASWFAEKHILQPGEFSLVWNELYPGGRDILLLRDFRDMAYSAIDFDRSHGYARFSDLPGEPFEPYVRRVRDVGEELRGAWAQRQGVHQVRYEDLVARPAESLAGVFEHAGVDASPATIEAVVSEAGEPMFRTQRHVTSPSVEESVGRWRQEADDSFRALCDELLGDLLRDFAYE